VRATVGPRTTTLAAERAWAASKNDPAVRFRLFVVAQMSVVPMMFAERNWMVLVSMSVPAPGTEPVAGVAALVTTGVTVAMSGAPCSAAASASVKFCAGGPPGTASAWGTMVMLLATGSMRASTEFFTPCPQADSRTTAETPMIRPNMVSVERSRCARNARSATSNASRRFIC
jgi:hypothetical protein